MNAHRNLGRVATKQARASARLSSGHRVNSAADDAAGLSISEKMRAQIRGLDQASRNASDGISLIQTAEGALSTINEILIRVRELVIQASNDTNVGGGGPQSDRLRIQDEIDQLMNEIDTIARRTEFNTRTLLNGSLNQDGVIRGGEWVTVDQVRTNAPALISTLDQFLRTTANQPFVGSFAELLVAIGANLEGKSAADWIAVHAGANFSGLEQALNAAMAGRWGQLREASGLDFRNAGELLDAFVQGLHNPNALRPIGDIIPGGPQQTFDSWADFVSSADPQLGASTFARAVSQAGGEALYQALIRAGFKGLDENSTFNDVRNLLYTKGGGWALGLMEYIGEALQTAAPGERSWLERRIGSLDPILLHVSDIVDLTGNGIVQTPGATLIVGGVSHVGMQYTLNGAIVPGAHEPVARITTRDGFVIISVREFDPPASAATNWWPDLNLVLEHPDGVTETVFGFGGILGGASPPLGETWPHPGGTGTIFYTGIAAPHEYFIVDNLPEGYTIRVEIRNTTGPSPHTFIVDILGLTGEERVLDPDAWNTFVNRYLKADTEIVQRDVWMPNERERERGVNLWFQTGANSSQGLNVEIGSMSTGTLFGREGANHSTDRRIINVLDVFGYNVQGGLVGGSIFGNGIDGPVVGGNRVNTLLEAIDAALATATRQRSALGAIQNRLEFTIDNLDIASENLNAANSRIRDADMAHEMMQLTQANVLQQAAISMLAQANQAPQSVLQLLG